MNTLLISELLAGYRARRFTPAQVIAAVLENIDRAPARHVWITRLAHEQVLDRARALEARSPEELPLYGVPFAIKDNIDLAGVPTTAGCPDFAYRPERSAAVVQKLIDAGAIPIGKTNMDQFATGLVGTRSPYGACRNGFDERFISGGSSSGSAVAVASGLVSFALGTDTAGSGRVPAAFNSIVGLKPSCGRVSTRGVVAACRSLDCVSIFALTAGDARRVLDVAQGFDAEDPFSQQPARWLRSISGPGGSRVGIPRRAQLEFFGDGAYAALFAESHARLADAGATLVEVDFEPFMQAARLLYEGPWVAERYAAIEHFLARRADAMHPVTRQIIAGGAEPTAVEAFRAQYRLKELGRAAEAIWQQIDVLMTPTAPAIYRIEEVLADPVRLNANLGYYTNFVNLLDLAAVAVPAGFRRDGLPFGVTFVGPAGADERLLRLAADFHYMCVARLGATETPVPQAEPAERGIEAGHVAVAVCGAHMTGLPLNHQLTERGGYLVRAARTSDCYRFYALPGGPPHRPGLVRADDGGAAIDVELWAMPQEHFGSFVAGIPSPLGIGKVELDDGSCHCGFLCETWAVKDAEEITGFASWRAFLQSRN